MQISPVISQIVIWDFDYALTFRLIMNESMGHKPKDAGLHEKKQLFC